MKTEISEETKHRLMLISSEEALERAVKYIAGLARYTSILKPALDPFEILQQAATYLILLGIESSNLDFNSDSEQIYNPNSMSSEQKEAFKRYQNEIGKYLN